MSDGETPARVDLVRRKLLKSSAVLGGVLAAGHLPYARPAVKSFFGTGAAWAQMSALSIQFCGDLLDLGGGVGTGQDAWEFETTVANTTLTIDATVTAGAAAVEIGLFAPGDPVTGTNVLTGSGNGYTGPFPVVQAVMPVGTFTIAIEDNFGDASEVPFSYCLDITGDQLLIPRTRVITGGAETLGPLGGP